MIILDPERDEEGDTWVSCSGLQASDDCYAILDFGTNDIIVPLHPDMCGETAECKVPNAVVHGPIVQVLRFVNRAWWLHFHNQPFLSHRRALLVEESLLGSYAGHCRQHLVGF